MVFASWGMIATGLIALLVGLVLLRPRLAAATGVRKILILGPLCEAVALAIFAAEHFLMAQQLMAIVPRWLPGALFWTYFVGLALLAAALSLIAWRCVRWSAPMLAPSKLNTNTAASRVTRLPTRGLRDLISHMFRFSACTGADRAISTAASMAR